MRYLHHLGFPVTDCHALPGEVDENFRLTTPGGEQLLLKVSPPYANSAQLDFQQAMMEHLADADLPFATPLARERYRIDSPEGPRFFRIHNWIEGRILDEVNPRTPALWRSWGETCGHLCRALVTFDHPAAHRVYKWDPLRVLDQQALAEYFNQDQKILAEYFFTRYRDLDVSHLRHSVNYNDAHEHNLLVGDDGRICGVVDVGDAVYTATVCELAIAAAYAGMGQADPLEAFRELVAGYHQIFPLEETELDVLLDLIVARLLLTVTTAAENARREPANRYLIVSQAPAWRLLGQLRAIHPALARAHFRTAAGLPAHPGRAAYRAWAATARPAPLLSPGDSRFVAMDLGVGSTDLGPNRNFESLPTFITHVRRHLEDHSADVGIGGYGETRPVYTTDDFASTGNHGPRWRSVHLGLDFWTRGAGVPVHAPLAGVVHGCGIDATAGGYGNTILLAHTPRPGLTFFTLYGHLSSDSLEGIQAGTQVQRGQEIARIGAPDENGGWPPHLHFQVTLDVLGKGFDFPGVAYPEEAGVWLGLCPDPRTLLADPLPEEVPHPDPLESLLTRRRQRLGYSLSVSYHRPLHILRGSLQYLYDHRGRRYLDTVNNVAHVGHEHPRVTEAARRQVGVLNTNSRYLHPQVIELAEALTATLPPELSVVHFVNSGSEANELALRMAEAATGHRGVVALEMGYHGNTTRTIDVSSYKFDRAGGQGRPQATQILPLPDLLRRHNLDPTPFLPLESASFIGEAILSCGGQQPLPDGYLTTVYRHVRASGGVCIADEVQTGLGRTGSHYWAFGLQGVVPDIVTIGKPLGNGHPLGAVVCTPQVAAAFATGMEYFNTFGGNPVSSAVGLAVLRVVQEEGLMERAREVGKYLTTQLVELRAEFPLVADVRGPGLFLGVELCAADLAPATAPAAYLKNRMRDLGFLMSTDGPHENVLKLKPPMCFSRENADLLVHYLRQVLREDGCRC